MSIEGLRRAGLSAPVALLLRARRPRRPPGRRPLTAVGMAFTCSIADGIGLGAISHVALKVAAGRA